MKRVLIACEYSGTVRDAFKAKGHYAMSCDLLDTDVPGNHYMGDIRDVLSDKSQTWDLMIAHPDCTYICNSGVAHLHKELGRMKKLYQACQFFKLFLNNKIPQICIENPIPHKYGRDWIGQKYSQIVQPWMFGHTEQKATCLWLKNLPKLKEENNVKEEMMKLSDAERQKMFYLSPGPDRWKLRSKTFEGLAKGMANQWG